MKHDQAILFDIWQATHDVIEFTNGLTRAKFQHNKLVHSAVIQKLMIIGEATKRLSLNFRRIHAHIPWKLMAGMRDKVIHEYFDVDFDEVWKTVKEDIPQLIVLLHPLIPRK